MSAPPQLTPEHRQALAEAVYGGRKIEAIKQLREVSGLGLKESKDIIEKLEAELRAAHPERFTTPASKNGCTVSTSLIIIVVVGMVMHFLRR
jgi:ribosomal protein L7/L12